MKTGRADVMTPDETETSLALLKAKKFEPFSDEDLDSIIQREHTPPWLTIDLLRDYMASFIITANVCPLCEGWNTSVWGLVHGETKCVRCSYPGRMYHFIPRPGEPETYRLVLHLWVHPKEVVVREITS